MIQSPLKHVRPEEVIQRYKSLIEVSRAIASHHNQAELFSELAHHMRQVVRFDFLNVLLYEPAYHVMRLYLLEGARHKDIEPGAEFPIDDSFEGWVWKNQNACVVRVDEETRFPKTLEVL